MKKGDKNKPTEEKADLAEEYPQYDQAWHEENDNYDDDYDSFAHETVSNLAMSSSFSSSCSSMQHGNLIESDSRYLCHPKWQAPLSYLLYLFILLIYTIGEKIVLVAHQLYKDLYRSEGVEIAFMTERRI